MLIKLLFALAFFSQIQCSDVIELNDDNFDEMVTNSTDFWMIEFYSPYCGHCLKLMPKWEEAATALKGKAKLGKVDVSTQEKLKTKYEIDSFPKLRVFHRGFDYGSGTENQKILDLPHTGQKTEELIKYGEDMSFDLQEEEIYAAEQRKKKEDKA